MARVESAAASRLADAFRRWGYLAADLDPFGRLPRFVHPDLEAARGAEAERWRAIYCGPIGAEFMHFPAWERSRFVAERMERPAPPPDRRRLLRRIAEAELFERFIHQRYVGTKRYSLEGSAALIPLLDTLIATAAEAGIETVLIGMSHRGRLNVMVHIVGTPPAAIFAGFEDIEPRATLGGGDVKYHLGATGTYRTASGRDVHVHLVSNPSHLEAVDPVVMGRARARQERLGPDGPARVLAITLHGDAAFAGQGIAAETLNLADLAGYTVAGTVHVVVDNLIGFTTEPKSLHSSRFASDVARRLEVPILHVNGEEPEAVVRAGVLVEEFRAAFKTDVVVDLIGYRRYGHSEVDDPTTTQPRLYAGIGARPMLWETYAARIGATERDTAGLRSAVEAALLSELERARSMTQKPELRTLPPWWSGFVGGRYDPSLEVDTAVPADRLAEIARRITAHPPRFHLHPKLARGLEQRLEMGQGRRPVDWGMAEALAFGALLWDGVPVRLSGQDSRRGTFNHRHAVLVDFETGEEHEPLAHLHDAQAAFSIYDSPLSEAGVLGFEYGYSRDYPEALVCWEAQFGDFANGAQVIIDQFLVSSEAKWVLLTGLVLLLPHGYEGQGPEHSSARIERFLALAGDHNIQVCQPSTAAQYFHLLRRQVLRRWRKPLVIATPKGLLRAPAASSPLADLVSGRFRPVLDDDQAEASGRVLLCSGRIAHDLRAERTRRGDRTTAIVTLEQFYPFPKDELLAALQRHPAGEIVWVQEEPRNMGGLEFVRARLQRLVPERPILTVARSEAGSPATGSARAHALEHEALLALAFARASRR